jgi:P pilus assembly chaperone PapD
MGYQSKRRSERSASRSYWLSQCRRLALPLVTLLCLARGQSEAGIVVNLGKLELELGPDVRATRELQIANTSDKPTEVSVFASDWTQDENGAVDAIDPGQNSRPSDSATAWIAVNPQRFILQKGERKTVSIAIATPKAAMGLKEYRSMIFTETTDVQKSQAGGPDRELQVRVIGRIGTKVFIRNPRGEKKVACEVTKVCEGSKDGKRGLLVEAKNEGNVYVKSENSTIALRAPGGETVATVPIPAFSILPGGTRLLFCELPKEGECRLQAGRKYSALAVIDYGGSDLVAGEYEFTF